MREPVPVQIRYVLWDANDAYPDGLDETSGAPRDVDELAESVAGAVATGGTALVLPGPDAHQALVMIVDGPGDGYSLTGSMVPGEPRR